MLKETLENVMKDQSMKSEKKETKSPTSPERNIKKSKNNRLLETNQYIPKRVK